MLHLIFQSINAPTLQRIEAGDDVVFFENAVLGVNKGNALSRELQQMHLNNIHLYVLKTEIEARGFLPDELFTGLEIIDYSDLVKLSEKNKLIRTWN